MRIDADGVKKDNKLFQNADDCTHIVSDHGGREAHPGASLARSVHASGSSRGYVFQKLGFSHSGIAHQAYVYVASDAHSVAQYPEAHIKYEIIDEKNIAR
jgi:hypothetical protein